MIDPNKLERRVKELENQIEKIHVAVWRAPSRLEINVCMKNMTRIKWVLGILFCMYFALVFMVAVNLNT